MAGLLDYLDFDNSGSLNFGDIGSGLGGLYDFGKGLVGSSGTIGTDGARTGTEGLMGFLTNNQDALKFGGNVLGAIGNYQQAQSQQDYAKGLLDLQRQQINTAEAERQRQIDKEEEAQQSMMTGFNQSGLSNYYGV